MAELERHFMCVFSSFLLDSIPQVKACCTKAPVELLPQGVVFSFKFWHSAEQNFTLPCETSELNVGMIRDDNKEPRLSRQNKTLYKTINNQDQQKQQRNNKLRQSKVKISKDAGAL